MTLVSSFYIGSFILKVYTILGSSLQYAVHPCPYIKENPMQYVKYPKYEHSKLEIGHKVITPEEFEMIIEKFPAGTTFYIPCLMVSSI